MGGAEVANKIIEGKLRSENLKLEKRLGIKLKKDEMLSPWSVRHAAWVVNRFQTGRDGKSAYQRIHGRPYRGAVVNFAEKVQFKDDRDRGKLEDRWPIGIWVGKLSLDDCHIILTPDGVRTVRSISRLSEDLKWDREFVKQVKGTPWNPLGVAHRDHLGADGSALHRTQSRKRVYITTPIIKRLGKTKGCEACIGKAHTLHTEACRKRITDLLEAERVSAEAAAKERAAAAQAMKSNKPGLPTAPSGEAAAGSGIPVSQGDKERADARMAEAEEMRQREFDDAMIDGEEEAPEKKRPKVYKFDDEVDGDEGINSLIEITDEHMMAAVMDVLEEGFEPGEL